MLWGDKAKQMCVNVVIKFWVGSCFEAQCLILRSVLFISNFSGDFQLQQLGKFVRIFQAPALISSPNRLTPALLRAAPFTEQLFLCGLWLKTLESSWLLGISQRILGHYASYSWSGDLGLWRLTRLFPLIPVFSFNPYFLLPVVLEVQSWAWTSPALAVATAMQLDFSRGSSWAFPARCGDPIVVLAVVFAPVEKGNV